jgi:hypothetical protein
MNRQKEYENYMECVDKKCKETFETYKNLVTDKLDSGKNMMDLGEDHEIKDSLKKFAEERDKQCGKSFQKYQEALKKGFNAAAKDYSNTKNKKSQKVNKKSQKVNKKSQKVNKKSGK